MTFSPEHLAFLETNHTAAMVTLTREGMPHAVRVGVALVDGNLWTSGTPGRVRTRHIRRDPRGALFVFGGQGNREYLAIEGRFRILDGPDGVENNVRLFQTMQAGRGDPGTLVWYGKPLDLGEFRQAMRDEARLVYELAPTRAYGLLARPGART